MINGEICEINLNDYINDCAYYKELIKIYKS